MDYCKGNPVVRLDPMGAKWILEYQQDSSSQTGNHFIPWGNSGIHLGGWIASVTQNSDNTSITLNAYTFAADGQWVEENGQFVPYHDDWVSLSGSITISIDQSGKISITKNLPEPSTRSAGDNSVTNAGQTSSGGGSAAIWSKADLNVNDNVIDLDKYTGIAFSKRCISDDDE